MQIKLCENCHVYDGDRYDHCPYCSGEQKPSVKPGQQNDGVVLQQAGTPEKGTRTLSPYSSFSGKDFVTGWLVCIEGEERGRDYRVHFGFNHVGRSVQSDINIADDLAVSEKTQCSIVYDPKSNAFYITPGKGTITYLNQQLVKKAMPLHPSDIIEIGNSRFIFIPFCTEGRTWKEKNQ